MGWFKRLKDGIQTTTKNKKDTPDGLWYKCKGCKETSTMKDHANNFHKCPVCNHHTRIGSHDYFNLLLGKYDLHFENIRSKDSLNFKDLKTYKDRLDEAHKKVDVKDAITVASGKINKHPIVIAAMDFSFIGGSMGAVVGEKISRAIDLAIERKVPFMIISKSGGARMMESAYSLMQMAKTAVKLSLLAKAGIPYLSFLTDPTTGGVTASYAMLGDINFSEPGALIAFAGPRVVADFTKQELPEGFQKAEFLLDHGFLDFIVDRKNLKEELSKVLDYLSVSA